MIDVHLKRVWTAAFTKSAHRQLEEFCTAEKGNTGLVADLKAGEAIMFLAKGRNQVRFVYRPLEAERQKLLGSADGWEPTHIYVSYVWVQVRLNGAFNPLMLANIAKQVGIRLVGIKYFEEHYQHLLEEDAALRRKERKAS
jgi:hypothetical protein